MMNYELLTEIDRQVLKESGYGARCGFGKKPALMIVDAQKKFVGPDLPVLEASKVYPISIGERANRAVERIVPLLDAARARELPVFYSTSGTARNELPFNSFIRKRTAHEVKREIPKDQEDIVPLIAPRENEWVIHKRYASGFFGTPLMTFLHTLGCDTIIVTGFVTSGCIRAFVVDAASYNFNVAIPEECVADRFESLHELSLLDMHIKYADVIPASEALDYMRQI